MTCIAAGLNEQFPPYWTGYFSRRGFRAVDLIRPQIWDDQNILVWIRQNMLLFVHDDLVNANDELARITNSQNSLAIVHPDLWMARSEALAHSNQELSRLVEYLKDGGLFRVHTNADGRLNILRVAEPQQQ